MEASRKLAPVSHSKGKKFLSLSTGIAFADAMPAFPDIGR